MKVRCVTPLYYLVSPAVSFQVSSNDHMSAPASLPHPLPSSLNLSPSPSPDRPSHQCPFPSVWLVPLPFTQMTLPPPRSFCLSGFPFAQMPPTKKPLPTPRRPLYLFVLYICLTLSPLRLDISVFLKKSVSNSVSCSGSASLSLILVLSHCTDAWLGSQQLSRHVPLPSVAFNCRASEGGGGLGVEGAERISHEYSCFSWMYYQTENGTTEQTPPI